MQRTAQIAGFALLVALAFAGLGRSQGSQESAEQAALKKLQAAYPRLPVTSVSKTPLAGAYEVLSGGNLLYFFPETGHVLVGVLWDSTGKNLTQERRDAISSQQVASLDLSKALKIGDGPHRVIEVTDPDCPFCRKGHEFLRTRKDVTRYVFFTVLANHPNAPRKAAYILSAPDPERAFEEVFSGKYDKEDPPAVKDNGRYGEQQRLVAGLGVQGTPHYWIDGQSVSGADVQKMQGLLEQAIKAGNTGQTGKTVTTNDKRK